MIFTILKGLGGGQLGLGFEGLEFESYTSRLGARNFGVFLSLFGKLGLEIIDAVIEIRFLWRCLCFFGANLGMLKNPKAIMQIR